MPVPVGITRPRGVGSLTQAKELAPFKCQIAGFVLRWVGDKFLMELGDLLDDAHRAAFDLGAC